MTEDRIPSMAEEQFWSRHKTRRGKAMGDRTWDHERGEDHYPEITQKRGNDREGNEYEPSDDHAKDVLGMIDQLRKNEGSSVIIHCSNPDFNGLPNECISVVDEWTEWEERDFRDNTLLGCLQAAIKARNERSARP